LYFACSTTAPRNTATSVEQREIDADLGAVDRGLILRVEEAGVGERHQRGLAAPLDRRAGKRHRSGAGKLRQQRLGLGAGQQHRLAQMPSGCFVAQDGIEQQALVDLQAGLFLLQQPVLGRDLARVRHQAGDEARGFCDQMLDPHEARAAVRQGVVDGAGVARQESPAGGARHVADCVRRRVLALIAMRRLRQACQQPGGILPPGREAGAIGSKIGRRAGLRLQPGLHVAVGQSRRRQAV
jgi:hypothetical protein